MHFPALNASGVALQLGFPGGGAGELLENGKCNQEVPEDLAP